MNSVEVVEKHIQHTFKPVIESRAAQQNTHIGITCDGCGRRNIFGIRHKCLECDGESEGQFHVRTSALMPLVQTTTYARLAYVRALNSTSTTVPTTSSPS